ncbi:MAG: hypothetical protein P8R36_04180 [Actinomycetota bacterium]|nr:hypothetical protein [Actinomycetota bacterium]MDG1489464.1 hypothetical protein [Actinomycetota bacterium]MDG2121448.1 hypothetical protein [Actinomycetota bacterium]NCG39816.1 hypothetical protein [Actinomycetota bacterium]
MTRGDSAAAASDDEFERSARTLFTMSAIGASPMTMIYMRTTEELFV